MISQSQTDEVKQKRPSSAHPSKAPRTSVLHWRKKVEQTVSQSGSVNGSYSVRIEWRKKRVRFAFDTSNKNIAASKAAQIYTFLIEHGWEKTIAKYKPSSAPQNKTNKDTGNKKEKQTQRDTVAHLIATNQKYSSAREQTLHTYIKAFRRIVSGVMELEEENSFLSRSECGNEAWREQVDGISLHTITPERIQNWKQYFLSQHSKTATAKKQATTTVNSLIRNSKALFSKKLLPILQQNMDLPSPLPFEGVTMEKPPSPSISQ